MPGSCTVCGKGGEIRPVRLKEAGAQELCPSCLRYLGEWIVPEVRLEDQEA